jgi:geranylgeranyl pyrophosphate synthase
MHTAQYRTTISATSLETFTLNDLENLAIKKASLLFQFCSAAPAYFADNLIKDSEDFGFQLGIVRQYVSDVHDFLEVPPEHDYNKKGVSEGGARMEDYYTHQPNLVLLLTGTSPKLDKDEKEWFYTNWTNPVSEGNRAAVMKRVVELVKKTEAIEEAKNVLKKIQEKLKKSLSNLPDEKFKEDMSKWAFRSFPLD